MSSSRDAFLERVRKALGAEHRPGGGAALEPRGSIGYQGAGQDPVARFCQELTAAGGIPHPVPDSAAATARVLELVQARSARRILLGKGRFLDALGLAERLQALGLETTRTDHPAAGWRDAFFAADVGISGVDCLIAETGTIAILSSPDEPRSLSLLPPVHIAVADHSQLLPDLFDLFQLPLWQEGGSPPSCLSLITGPSKTGDIELRLVTGVHGPGELHVIVIG